MTEQSNGKDLKASIVDRIASEGIKPHPKAYWLLIDVAVWGLWVLAVLVGALAVSVLLFASIQMSFELYEATSNSVIDFMMEWLPFIWIFILIIMSAVAYFNMRHTKRGYKYPLSVVILSSVGASIVGGFVLHIIGVGYYLDTYLGRTMPMYHSQEMMGTKSWQDPESGRWVGHFFGDFEDIEMLQFEDMKGQIWKVSVTELRPMDMRLIRSGETVRVIGVVATATPRLIHGCGVFPWLFDKQPALDELKEQRRIFVERMDLDSDEADDRTEAGSRQGYCRPMPIGGRSTSQ